LRAVLLIAARGTQVPLSVERIATVLHVPRNYLGKTMHQLARAGVLASARGRAGGFSLAVAADHLSLADVVAPFMAPALPERADLAGLGDRMRAVLQDTTVAELLRPPNPTERKRAHGSPTR
jgi:Rrf2 family protein